MKDSDRIEYLEARVSALEELIGSIIGYHQAKNDRYQCSYPSEANFWCEQIGNLTYSITARLDNLYNDLNKDK